MVSAEITKRDLRELLTKGWMTHDAMWFYSCYQELGIEKTNALNKSAIGLMAVIETKRMLKALGMKGERFDGFGKVWQFLQGAREFVVPDWMECTFSSPCENVIAWQWGSCFAHQGLTRLGAIDRYECGVMYRIECWLNVLGAEYEIRPPIKGCLMHELGECRGEIRFSF